MSTTTSSLIEALNWRYAVKKFDPAKKIDATTWSALEQSLLLAPSSFGLQPWKFIVVNDPAIRAKLVGASWGQTQIAEASHLVVFAFNKQIDTAHVEKFLARQIEVRGGDVASLDGYKKMMLGSLEGARAKGYLETWQSRQVYIALGQFMASAALLGVDTCPMEGLDPAQYDQILGLVGTSFTTLCACPAGYRAADDKYATAAKVRFPISEVITHL
jgi:nitroreductase